MSVLRPARGTEDDDEDLGPELTTGHVTLADEDRWDSADAVLWVPDLSSASGYSKFWVTRGERQQRRPLGFRRR